jgi:hypothetical protein
MAILLKPNLLYPLIRKKRTEWLTTNESIFIRCSEADLAAVAEYCAFDQIDFADGIHISGRSGEAACSARQMQGISYNGEQGLRERNGRSSRRIEAQRVPRFGNPVMLDMKYQSVTRARMRRAAAAFHSPRPAFLERERRGRSIGRS